MSLEVTLSKFGQAVAVFQAPATLRVLFQEHGCAVTSAKLDQSKKTRNAPYLIQPWDTAFSIHQSRREKTL